MVSSAVNTTKRMYTYRKILRFSCSRSYLMMPLQLQLLRNYVLELLQVIIIIIIVVVVVVVVVIMNVCTFRAMSPVPWNSFTFG